MFTKTSAPAVSTMSLSARPTHRVLVRAVSRSQSFAGINSYDKPYRSLSVFSTPVCVRKSSSRGSRMFAHSAKSPPPKVPQPERLDEVYEALKRGLQSYLQVHQLELDSLNRQMRESKRNSRLLIYIVFSVCVCVFSQIDELYEAYCMQRRLRDGANKMVKAYTASPGSREARESLSEANKGFKEYTENMCMLESELESQLGEFHIKMKGLAGFARLCAGDQYEIFMKYGRQRWKLRGRIEMNGKQVWDSEEMVFLPLITEFLSIKVTELKSLANHVVVGNVSCETKDLFSALPQTVAVDINDLGTIKLSLEVTWNPFDKDDPTSTASTVNKPPTVNKRFSTYNQSPPDTPSLREQAFYNMLRRQDEMENGTAWSNSSESSDDSSSPQLSLGIRHTHKNLVQPELQAASPAIEISFDPRESATSTPTRLKQEVPNGHARCSRSLSHISEISIDAALTDRPAGEPSEPSNAASLLSAMSITNVVTDMTHRAEPCLVIPEPQEDNLTSELAGPGTSSCTESSSSAAADEAGISAPEPEELAVALPSNASSTSPTLSEKDSICTSPRTEALTGQSDTVPAGAENIKQAQRTQCLSQARTGPPRAEKPGAGVEAFREDSVTGRAADSSVEEALAAALSSLDDYRGQFPELQVLEQELKLLEEALTVNLYCFRASSLCSCQPVAAESVAEENCENHSCDAPSEPLSTGCQVLDRTLLVHLQNCSSQLLRLGMFGPLRCGEMYALDRLLREARVLELIRRAAKGMLGRAIKPEEGGLTLSLQCLDGSTVFSTSTEAFIQTLSSTYANRLPERCTVPANTVFLCLVERILERKLPRRGRGASKEMVTIFQFWSYLEAEGVSELDVHITELAEEVWLVQCLQSGDQDVCLKALKRPPEGALKREGLRAVSLLLGDSRGKLCGGAGSLLRSLADQPRHRERVRALCLELLEDKCVETRVCGCKALACLKAKESIEPLVYLCRTDREEVRDAAKQALMLLGEEGKIAHRHVESAQDGLPCLFTPGSMASTAF
uniref:FAM65 N-terminal domain-containing protein n=1 Tax=Electrophorus electricus TaxID=8005 RepID=A0A4W4HJF2_ELEEL